LIGDTDGAVVERNVAWNNGQNCNHTSGGTGGIWAWDSNTVTLQYNEATQQDRLGEPRRRRV
jgi:hypothetical protein